MSPSGSPPQKRSHPSTLQEESSPEKRQRTSSNMSLNHIEPEMDDEEDEWEDVEFDANTFKNLPGDSGENSYSAEEEAVADEEEEKDDDGGVFVYPYRNKFQPTLSPIPEEDEEGDEENPFEKTFGNAVYKPPVYKQSRFRTNRSREYYLSRDYPGLLKMSNPQNNNNNPADKGKGKAKADPIAPVPTTTSGSVATGTSTSAPITPRVTGIAAQAPIAPPGTPGPSGTSATAKLGGTVVNGQRIIGPISGRRAQEQPLLGAGRNYKDPFFYSLFLDFKSGVQDFVKEQDDKAKKAAGPANDNGGLEMNRLRITDPAEVPGFASSSKDNEKGKGKAPVPPVGEDDDGEDGEDMEKMDETADGGNGGGAAV